MDIVIPLGNESPHDNLELRYCLRGIDKFVPDLGNVFIIGVLPSFVKGVIHIPFRDLPERHWKARNICNKLLAACGDKRVSDDFAWFSDDHFLLREYQPDYNHRGLLKECINCFTPHQKYRLTIINTWIKLPDGYDYGHGPMVFNKEKFKRAMACVDWSERYGYVIKSIYCGLNGIEGGVLADVKVKRPMGIKDILALIDGRPYFSVGDDGINSDMLRVLDYLFPNKSRFEV